MSEGPGERGGSPADPSSEPTVDWDLAGITLAVSGDRRRVAHLAREYAAAMAPPDGRVPDVAVTFRRTTGPVDRHKGTWWRVRVGPPDASTLTIDVEAHGPFADAMVQSLVVEPMVGTRANAHGLVMISGAVLTAPGGGTTTLVIGGSRAGKSVLALAARLAGWDVVADDRATIDARGLVRGLPRRMRLYPSSIDLFAGASGQLTPGERQQLAWMRVLGRLTAGSVRMPILVPPTRFGTPSAAGPKTARSIDAVVLVSRDPGVSANDIDAIDTQRAVAAAIDVIDADRSRSLALIGDTWAGWMANLRAAEVATLERAFRHVPAYRLAAPMTQRPEVTLATIRDLGGTGRD